LICKTVINKVSPSFRQQQPNNRQVLLTLMPNLSKGTINQK
jgi:hypothetical protein